jgi:hypothetical protein
LIGGICRGVPVGPERQSYAFRAMIARRPGSRTGIFILPQINHATTSQAVNVLRRMPFAERISVLSPSATRLDRQNGAHV